MVLSLGIKSIIYHITQGKFHASFSANAASGKLNKLADNVDNRYNVRINAGHSLASEKGISYIRKGPILMEGKTERNLYQSAIAERLKRKSVHFPARLIIGERLYTGFIINISCRGVGMYVVTKFSEGTIDCSGGSVLTLETRSLSGDLLSLQCNIKWLRIREHSHENLTTSIGMEIIDPPDGFVRLFESVP